EGSTGLTDDEVAQIAVDAGVPQDVADQIGDGTYTEWVDKATEQAGNDGVSQTPTVKLNGEVWEGNWSQSGTLLSAIGDAWPRPFVWVCAGPGFSLSGPNLAHSPRPVLRRRRR